MYELELTDGEFASLRWLAGRYLSAQVVFDGKRILSEATVNGEPISIYSIPEHIAWEFREACDGEDGGFVPCCGGSLAAKLLDLLQAVV